MSVRPTQVDPRFPLLVAAAVEPENSRAASSSQPLRSPMHFTCVLSQPKKQPKNQLDLLVLLVLFWLGLCSTLPACLLFICVSFTEKKCLSVCRTSAMRTDLLDPSSLKKLFLHSAYTIITVVAFCKSYYRLCAL